MKSSELSYRRGANGKGVREMIINSEREVVGSALRRVG